MIHDLDTLAQELVGAHRAVFQVIAGNGGVASGFSYHMWNYTGAAGAVPGPPGRTVGRVLAQPQGGMMWRWPDAVAGEKLYIARAQALHSVSAAVALVDRLVEVTVPVDAVANVAVNSVALPARATGGRDVEMWVEARITQGTVSTFTVDYINQDGVAKTTPSFTLPAINVNRTYQIPLAQGDTGVRQIVNVNVTTASTTVGNSLAFVLIRDLLMIPVANTWAERDWLASIMCPIDNDAGLSVIYNSGASSSRLLVVALDIVSG